MFQFTFSVNPFRTLTIARHQGRNPLVILLQDNDEGALSVLSLNTFSRRIPFGCSLLSVDMSGELDTRD